MTRNYRLIAKFMYNLNSSKNKNNFDLSEYPLKIDSDYIKNIVDKFQHNLLNGKNTTVHYSGKKDAKFYNMIIRWSVEDYNKKSRFDNVNWIIVKIEKNYLEFIISFWDENYSIETIKKNFWAELFYRRIVVTDYEVFEIDLKEFMTTHKESMDKGFIECSTAWINEAGRFDYIHELYEDNE